MNKDKNFTITEVFNLAVDNQQKNKLDVAQKLYLKILTINPNHSSAYNNLGVIFENLGDYQRAMGCYKKAIVNNPKYIDALNNLGALFQRSKNYQKAKECYERMIEINPQSIIALNNLGALFQRSKNYQKAKECYEKAFTIDPNQILTLNNLGNLFINLKDYQKARDYFEKGIKINPNFANTYSNLGILFNITGEYIKAIDSFYKVMLINPEDERLAAQIVETFRYVKVERIPNTNIANLKKLFLFLFKKNNIDFSTITKNAKSILFSNDEQDQLEEAINSNSLLSNKILQRLLKEELFYLLLQKCLISDIFLEKLLTKIRYDILYVLINSNKYNLKEDFNFIISLAEHCWLNEYVYIQSEKEINEISKLTRRIEDNNEIEELQISILGCYQPLNSSKKIIDKLMNYKSSNLLFNDLISMQIIEPLKEIELVKSIKSLDKIKDSISIKVRDQYEKNPYPRWRITQKYLPANYFTYLNSDIGPNNVDYNDKFNNPKVLIAGCGTGDHAISTTRYKNSNILAVDLSLNSLAYAKRKTEELGYKNIEYMHADILQLNKLNKKFDIIESSGTLHHMKDPLVGLQILLNLLKPHGYLKLALYSEKAREHVVATREFIKNKNYKNTNEDIKIFRQHIINKEVDPLIKKIILSRDFYSTSNVRDLLFHIQEHRFTIPQISKILKDFNLEFLGFIFQNQFIKKDYFKYFPEDEKNTALDNWHEYEKKNPGTFRGMYQFWVRKI
ncbi:tetratricopeptide repeat protein [Candidatus Pelagibacter sp.]|nr:tetratricopeptide repeat protein [Candidatus Pelagibacter sp.]